MAAAALLALVHDLVLTLGIYALVRSRLTPATLISVLTILGYSLYDTVVVFDKVRENTRDLKSVRPRPTPGGEPRRQPDPRALDQHHGDRRAAGRGAAVRRHGDLGRGTAQGPCSRPVRRHDLGRYSSIFITPLLAQLKEREPEMKKLASRVAARRAKDHKARGAQEVSSRIRHGPAAPCRSRLRSPAASTPVPAAGVPAGAAAAIDPEPDRRRARMRWPTPRSVLGPASGSVGWKAAAVRICGRPARARPSARSRSTSRAASARSSRGGGAGHGGAGPGGGRMSLSGAVRRDGRTRSWSHEALVSLPARTSSPGIELFRRACSLSPWSRWW